MPSYALQYTAPALISCVLYYLLRLRSRKFPLPPGPKGLPLLGNIYDVPEKQAWLAFIEMSQKYDSDIISLNLMGTTVIVLNSATSIQTLLEDKSIIYSNRPSFPMVNDLVGYNWNFGFMPYGPKWKQHRKIFVQQFQPSQMLFHRPLELKAARVLLQRLLETPTKFEQHLRHMAGTVILSTAYGIDVQPENDPYIEIAERALYALARAGRRGAYLVDSLPFLKYVPDFFPGASFKRDARKWRKAVSAMPEAPFNFVKRSLADGTAKSSIASRVLQDMDDAQSTQDQELVLKNVLGVCYATHRSEQTVSVLNTFILAMTLHPKIQEKARAAVDHAVGKSRLPDFDDKIPYLDAVLREVLRWRPVVPLAIPHAVSEDDVYNDCYYIPRGAVVLGNSWAILHDEAIYGPKPDEFIPERWLNKDGEINTAMREPSAAFGFGRRSCPGREMAQWSVWICAASILATFNISKSVDENGVTLEPSGEYTSGMLCHPVPYSCEIVPRSTSVRDMIQDALQI
ncbi:cytochrome P450 [Mycena galopus ATCC 62051]|nr:cytochrome P450 [Mycena galopus ATCC 62051]